MEPICSECGGELTPNSAAFDGYGTERWYCYNPDCDAEPTTRPY